MIEPTSATEAIATLQPLVMDWATLSETGLVLRKKPTYDQWDGIGELLANFERGLQFMIGDWANQGEMIFGEEASHAIDHGRFAAETLRQFRWVAERVPPENRRPDLSFDHHVAVAALPPANQKQWLTRAVDAASENDGDGKPWSANRMRAEMAREGAKALTLVYLLFVDCQSADKQQQLSVELEQRGFRTSKKEAAKKKDDPTAPKKGEITARKKRAT